MKRPIVVSKYFIPANSELRLKIIAYLIAKGESGMENTKCLALCCECAKAANKFKPIGSAQEKVECAICKRVGFHRIYSCGND